MIIVNGKRYEDVKDFTVSIKEEFKKRYKKNLAVCDKVVGEKRAIYGATLWSGVLGLPWFLSFDLDEVLDYLISHTNWNTHPNLTRVEVINFGEHPKQRIVGYLYADKTQDGYLCF